MVPRSAGDGRGFRYTCPHSAHFTKRNGLDAVLYSKSYPYASGSGRFDPQSAHRVSIRSSRTAPDPCGLRPASEDSALDGDAMLSQVPELLFVDLTVTVPRNRRPEVMDRVIVVVQHERCEPADGDDARSREPVRRQATVRQIVD